MDLNRELSGYENAFMPLTRFTASGDRELYVQHMFISGNSPFIYISESTTHSGYVFSTKEVVFSNLE
jgi:hypothetical protein